MIRVGSPATGRLLAAWLLLSLAQASLAEESPEEDPERIRFHWETAMTPEEYQHALQATGMEAALGASQLRGGDEWFSTGPVGGISNGAGQFYGGRISSIQFRSNGTAYDIFVGACSGGLWKADILDPVGTWTSLGDHLPNQSVRAFSVHPTNINDIVVGTGDLNRFPGSGMYRTTNGGSNWIQVTLPISTPMAFGRMHRSTANPNLLVACAMSGGVLRSTDGGVSWAVTLSGSVNDIAVEPANFNVQYAAKDGVGAFKSTNGGLTWTQMSITLPDGVGFSHGFLAVCRDAPQNVGIFLSQSAFQVLRSTNSGATWSNITGTLGQTGEGEWHMNEFFHTGAITFRPDNPNEIYVGARGFQKTGNDGATWDDVLDTHADITQLSFADQSGDNFLWICMDGGVIGRTLGGALEHWNGNSITGLRCFQVDYLDSKRGIRAIGTQDNGANYSTNGGSTWSLSGGGDAWDCEIVDDLSMEIWHADGVYSSPGVRINRRRLSGLTATNNTAEGMDGLFYNRFVGWMYSIGDDDVIYGCNVAQSPLTWVVDGTIPPELSVGRTPSGSYVDGRTLYANTYSGPIAVIARLSGPWNVQTYNFGGSGVVKCIYASTENAGEAWATLFRNGPGEPLIFHTVNYGASWTDVTGNLTSLKKVFCLVQKPFEPHVLYVGTDVGVFTTTDGGTTWQPFQTGMPIIPCTDMRYIVDPNHGGFDRLVVATYGRGIYERGVSSFPIVYVHTDSPSTVEDGTYDHPYDTYVEGNANVPAGGSLGLYGGSYFPITGVTLSAPRVLRAYGGTVTIGQ